MTRYRSFETTIKIIEKAGWRIPTPLVLDDLDAAAAETFIEKPRVGDKRNNWNSDSLRVLNVHLEDGCRVEGKDPIVRAAVRHSWIPAEFVRLLESERAESSISSTAPGRNSLIMQAPKNGTGTFTLVLTEIHNGRRNENGRPEKSWVSIIFAHQDIHLESLLCNDPFPADYSSVAPDFMILPVSLLRRQVDVVVRQLEELTNSVVCEEERLCSASSLAELDMGRRQIFELSKLHLTTRRRWTFGQEVAETLLKCFVMLENAHSTDEAAAKYSETLRRRVQTEDRLCKSLRGEMQSVSLKLESQRKMIDSRFHMMIAQSSAECAEKSRRDSSSMKTMASMTLLFLPATSISSIFSMGMFDWKAEGAGQVGSRYLWLYFVIAVPLTVVVFLIWNVWFKRRQRKYEARREQIESKC